MYLKIHVKQLRNKLDSFVMTWLSETMIVAFFDSCMIEL